MSNGWIIKVTGLVQGVGFRPTVWQVARSLGLKGSVRNTSAGVTIELACSDIHRDHFLTELRAGLPKLARIDDVEIEPCRFASAPASFTIEESVTGKTSASIVADAMICEACHKEILDPANRRYRYAFANCTHCGPRLTIVRKIPYDRKNTAMAAFPMCADCRAEYENPADRRFHAEPIACAACGPKLALEIAEGIKMPDPDPLEAAALLLLAGKIVAIKGLGGFHLACRADDDAVVARMRVAKLRPDKPLALMAHSMDALRMFAECSSEEAEVLANRSAPIVLLRRKPDDLIAPSVAPRQNSVGVMLPTTPLHVLLMDRVRLPLVMTSANESGIPQCITNDDARKLLGSIADAVLMHDRDIVSRVDDSVARIDATGPTLIRRARGYAPEPLRLPTALHSNKSVFAAGADLKSAFAFAGHGEATISQHLGDLDEQETRQAYQDAIRLYATMFDRKPDIVAIDSHPDYVSSRFGRAFAEETGAELVKIQHHHAHLAACLAEHDLSDTKALGIILDGTGFGDDSTMWGGEFLIGDCSGFMRAAHFLPVPLIGGDKASVEPWRNAYAHLAAAYGVDFIEKDLAFPESIQTLKTKPLTAIRSVMASRKLSPLSSSAGRLFDAAASLIGTASERVGYEGQTGMELEALAYANMAQARSFAETAPGDVLAWKSLWSGLLAGIREGREKSLLAADFHQTLIDVVGLKAEVICSAQGLDTVCLSGGVFQNAILMEGICARLRKSGLQVLVHHQVPANDGGIALGQAVIALAK